MSRTTSVTGPASGGTATPVQNVDFNLRGTYEGFHFTNPQETPTRDEWDWRYFTIDTANVKLTEVGGSPLSMTLGRQDLIYGDAWLILGRHAAGRLQDDLL